MDFAEDLAIGVEEGEAVRYSYLKESTGLALAAFIAWYPSVMKETAKIRIEDKIKIPEFLVQGF